MRQFAEGEWPTSELTPVAVLGREPDELAGVVFADDEDERLGPFRWAAVEAGGVRFLLTRLAWNREPGTVVRAEADDAAHDEGLRALLAELGLDPSVITWRPPAG
jgi:hypothetical protein